MKSIQCLLALSGVGAAFLPPSALHDVLTTRETFSGTKISQTFTIQIPVDHYNTSDHRTYSNKYWMNSEHYQQRGPIFYFDGGEGNAQSLVGLLLYEVAGPSSVMSLARR